MELTKEPNFSQGRSYCRGCLFYWLKRILWCVALSVFKNVTHQYHKLLLCMCRQNILLLVCPRSCRIPQQRCHWTCTTFLYSHCHLHHSFWEKNLKTKQNEQQQQKNRNKKINVTGIRILSKSYYSMMFSVHIFPWPTIKYQPLFEKWVPRRIKDWIRENDGNRSKRSRGVFLNVLWVARWW